MRVGLSLCWRRAFVVFANDFKQLPTVIKPPVETSSEQEMHSRWSLREVRVYVAFAIGDAGDLRSFVQNVRRPLYAGEPAARPLVSRWASRMMHVLTFPSVLDRNTGKSEQFTGHGINGENRMQEHTTKLAALADRAISP